MANPEHLAKLLEGGTAWNEWKLANPHIKPDISHTDFMAKSIDTSRLVSSDDNRGSCLDFSHVDFSNTNMKSVNIVNAKFWATNFSKTDLGESKIASCNFFGAKFDSSIFYRCNLFGSSFWATDLRKTNFVEADLRYAIFTSAKLQRSFLKKAKLQNAILVEANLRNADLSDACLVGADLRKANLEGANVTGVKFEPNTSRQQHYQGIRLAGAYGSQIFKSFAQDQDYIEELRKLKPAVFNLWWVFANCGRSFCLWAGWSLVLAVSFGFIYYIMGPNHIKPDPPLPFSIVTMIYYSVVTFTTLGFGDVKPQTDVAALLVMVEVIIGYVMLGGLISILANKLARRS